MGQCLSVLSRDRRRSKVESLEVKQNSGSRKENTRKKMRRSEKIKGREEEPKLGAKEKDENCHPNVENDIEVNSISSVSEESFHTLEKETKEDSVKGNEDNETEKMGKNESVTTFNGDCSATNCNRVIVVQPAKEETLSFGSRDNIASAHEPSLPNLSKVSSLISQKPKCVYHYQGLEGNCVGVVEEWDVEGLRCLANTFTQPSEVGVTDNQHLRALGLYRDENMMEAKHVTKFAKYKKSEKVAHLAMGKQLFGDSQVSRESQPRNLSIGIQDDDLEVDTKQGISTTNKGTYKEIGKIYCDTLRRITYCDTLARRGKAYFKLSIK